MTREFATMVELSVSMEVRAPVDRVWAALTDWDRQGRWTLGTRVRGTVQDGRGFGGEIEAVTGIGRLRILDKMRVAPLGAAARLPGDALRRAGAGHRRVRRTRAPRRRHRGVVRTLDLPLRLLGRLGWPAIRPAVRWGLTRSLRRFARWATTA